MREHGSSAAPPDVAVAKAPTASAQSQDWHEGSQSQFAVEGVEFVAVGTVVGIDASDTDVPVSPSPYINA